MSFRKFCAYSAAILLLALLIREWFVIAAIFPNPAQGDVSSYLRYAIHLVEDGVFSYAEYSQPVVPDAYRGPGYPFFLAMILRVAGDGSWIPAIQQAQALLGTLTVFAVIAMGRIAIGDRPALLAGTWMACEPHNIAATGTVMTEVLFGCLISLALLYVLRTLSSGSLTAAMVAGAFFACAYLVNPVVALFPVMLFVYFLRRGDAKPGLVILAVTLVAIGGWETRNQIVHAQSGVRATQNFVQGSWPDYHGAWKYHVVDPMQRETYEQINEEINSTIKDKAKGLAGVYGRMALDPARYVLWYFVQKPFLLWDWDIRLGAGGVNYLETLNSPLDRSPVLRSITLLQQYANPMLFALAVLGAIFALRWRHALPLALFFVYATVLHDIFQADPRYSTSYKSVEILLAVGAAVYFHRAVSRLLQRNSAVRLWEH